MRISAEYSNYSMTGTSNSLTIFSELHAPAICIAYNLALITHSLKTLSTFKMRFADQYYHRPSGVQVWGERHPPIRFHRQPQQARGPVASLQTPPAAPADPLSFPPPQFSLHNVPWVADRLSHSLRCTDTAFNSAVRGHNRQTQQMTALATQGGPCGGTHQLRRAGSRPPTAGLQPRRRSVPLWTLRGPLRRPPPRPAGGLGRVPAVGRCRLGRSGPPSGPGAGLGVSGAAGAGTAGLLLARLTKSPRDNRLLGIKGTGELGALHLDTVLS